MNKRKKNINIYPSRCREKGGGEERERKKEGERGGEEEGRDKVGRERVERRRERKRGERRRK